MVSDKDRPKMEKGDYSCSAETGEGGRGARCKIQVRLLVAEDKNANENSF